MATTGYRPEERTRAEAARVAAEMLGVAPGGDVLVIFYAEGGSYIVRSMSGGFAQASLDYYAGVTRRSGPDARAYLVRVASITDRA